MSDIKYTLKATEGKPYITKGNFHRGTLSFKLKADNHFMMYMEEAIRRALTHYNEVKE